MNDSVKRIKGVEGAKGDKLVVVGVAKVANMNGKSGTELLIMSNELKRFFWRS